MSYENDNEERRLFDQIVLQLVSCGSTEPPEVIATRVIDRRRAYFDANTLNAEIERQRGVIRSQNNEIARMQERIIDVTKQRYEEHGLAQFRAIEIDTWKKELAEARGRIAELESRPDAAEVLQRVLSQYEGKAMSAAENELLQDIARKVASITDPSKPTKPLYERISHEELYRVYIRPLEDLGFKVQRPDSIHWGQVTESLRMAIDGLTGCEK